MAKTARLAAQGALILSELNDLKRTIPSCANDLGWSEADVSDVIAGSADERLVAKFIDDCTEYYPVRRSALILPQSDCHNGVKLFPLNDSVASARVFDRPNASGEKTPYYEYRDTAASKLSDYRPEWIEQLRVVDNNDPENPDVIYNNGHFMHQVTFFVGPVNFYYEIDGVKYCDEMETGGSNYITPFYPHSFTSRDKDQQAYIIAVTFGGHAKRALGDLMTLGTERSRKFLIDRSSAALATQDLLDFHLGNLKLNRSILQKRLARGGCCSG
jgi:methylphosphonate synthase